MKKKRKGDKTMKLCVFTCGSAYLHDERKGVDWFEYDRDDECLILHYKNKPDEKLEVSYRHTFCAYQE